MNKDQENKASGAIAYLRNTIFGDENNEPVFTYVPKLLEAKKHIDNLEKLEKDNQALIELVNDFLESNNCTGECYRYHRLNKKCEHQELSEKAEKWKGK